MLALLFPLVLVTPQSVDHSVLHPADSLVYFEMADVQGVYRGYEGTAYGQVLADPDCRTALEKLLREETGAFSDPSLALDKKLNMLTGGNWSLLKPVLSEISTVSFSLSLHDTTPAHLVEGMDQEGFWDDDTLFLRLESAMRVQLIVDFTSEAASSMAFQALGGAVSAAVPKGAGVVVGKGTYEGRPVGHILAPRLPETKMPAGVFQDGNRVVFVLGADPILEMEAGSKRAVKLTSAERFFEGSKNFQDQSAGITVFQFKSRLAESFYGVCPEKEYIQPVIDLIGNALGPDFDMLLRGGDWRVQLRGETFVTESYQVDLDLGPYDRLFSAKKLNPKALDYVHEDAVIANAISLDSEILVSMLSNMFADLGEDPFSDWRQKYDFRPGEDLLAHLGSTWVSSLPMDSIGVTSLPGLSLWVDLNDRSGFVLGMEKLVQVVNSEAGDDLVARGKTYRKHRLYTFKGKNVSGPEAMLQPTVVVFEDRILVSISRLRAQKEIKRTLSAPDEVTAHAFFNSGALNEGERTVDMSYADWAKFLGRLYMGAKGLLPMVTGGMSDEIRSEIPVDLSELPSADLFTKFFKPATRRRMRVPGGVVMRSSSSFGPEMSGVIAGSMIGGLFMARSSMSHLEPIEVEAIIVIEEEPVEELQDGAPVPRKL